MDRSSFILNVLHELKLIREVANIVLAYAQELCGVVVEKKQFHADYLAVHNNTYTAVNGTVMLVSWSMETFTTRSVRLEKEDIWALTTLPSSGAVVTGTLDGTVIIWDDLMTSELQRWRAHESAVSILFVLPNGVLISGSRNSTVASNLKDGTHREIVDCAQVSALVISSDGYLIVGQPSGCIFMFQDQDFFTPNPRRELPRHQRRVTALAVLHNGMLLSSSLEGTVNLSNPFTGELLRTMEFNSEVWDLAVLPDGRFVTGCLNGAVQIWDRATFALVHTLMPANPMFHVYCYPKLAVFANGCLIFNRNSQITIWR